jgi:dTDP-4-amino-4,6-dideoxy-D-galactose acyltransferase
MMQGYEYLKWDSIFFNKKIANILPEELTSASLEQAIHQLKKENFQLAYLALDKNTLIDESVLVSQNGLLVDQKVTFGIDLKEVVDFNKFLGERIEVYQEQEINKELLELALQSGVYSRYRIDPRFSELEFERLYTAWIVNSLNKKIADDVLVARDENLKIVGMVTVKNKNGIGSIGIIAVAPQMRGKGVGTHLTLAALEWFKNSKCSEARVVTQHDNKGAMELYNKCGFKIYKSEKFYHFWLH